MKGIALSIFFFAMLVGSAAAQPQRVGSVIHDQHTIASKVLNEERSVLVKVPNTYERGERFPVVYMLDAHWPQNEMMGGLVEQQAWGGKMPEVIVVGIQNIARLRDLTPTATADRRGSGGGQKFLQFIETEVIPFVEKNYRTQPYRIFAGHSLGGLFVIYSFVERPDLFDAYIAASPVLDWDNNYVIKRAEATFKQNKEWRKRLFVGLGNEPDYVAGYSSFQSLLKRAKPKDFEYAFEQFKDENHGSVVLPAYYAGFRNIFDGWELPAVDTVAQALAHFRRLSERYGYAIKPPENLMNNIGYNFLRLNQNDAAIEAFSKNTEFYPNSANAFDSLAEAYERSGRMKSARDNYEKAYKMAEQQKELRLAESAKANFERISGKIK